MSGGRGAALLVGVAASRAEALTQQLEREGLRVEAAAHGEPSYDRVIGERFESVWVDVSDEGQAVLAWIERIHRLAPELPLVALAPASSERAREALERGAYGVIEDPEDEDVVVTLLWQVRALRVLERERRELLTQARSNARFYEDVLRSVSEGILVFDDRGHIRFQNDEARRLLGEEEEEEPADAAVQMRKSVVSQVLQQIASTLAEGREERRMVVADGEGRRIHLEVQTTRLRAADGRSQGAVAVMRDRSVEMLLEAQLVHTERLATLGGLLASIAHDIQNPLTCVTGAAEFGLSVAVSEAEQAAEGCEGAPREALLQASRDMRELFEQIQEAGLRCQGIADNLLAYSRRAPSQVRRADLNETLRKQLEFVSRYRKLDDIEVCFDLDPSLPPAAVNAAEVGQALTNLIDNAVQAMEGSPRRRLELRSEGKGREAILEIADTGPGMPEARLNKIWEPFFTTKASGTGLGLHITRRVIENQGGRISVESQVGEGTRFRIVLPLA